MNHKEWSAWLRERQVCILAVRWSDRSIQGLRERCGVVLVPIGWPPASVLELVYHARGEEGVREIVPGVLPHELRMLASLDEPLKAAGQLEPSALWRMTTWEDKRFDWLRSTAIIEHATPEIRNFSAPIHLAPLSCCEAPAVAQLPALLDTGAFEAHTNAIAATLPSCGVIAYGWSQLWEAWQVVVWPERHDVLRCVLEFAEPHDAALKDAADEGLFL